MGFLTKASREQDAGDTESNIEDQYLNIYGKIARDFISRDDLKLIVGRIMSIIDPGGLLPIDLDNDSGARAKGLLYKKLRDAGEDISRRFPDVVDMRE